mmetsp:Transcript_5529/g.11372  ORF Transcript_5529/g.11372 Transcript_5529/m.11372 type:complete len:86 (+) Transcript_5529:1355-1612(+)
MENKEEKENEREKEKPCPISAAREANVKGLSSEATGIPFYPVVHPAVKLSMVLWKLPLSVANRCFQASALAVDKNLPAPKIFYPS